MLGRRQYLIAGCATLLSAVGGAVHADPATYRVSWDGTAPPRLSVSAVLPIDGQTLDMDTTRPGDIPELDAGGWPALVKRLKVVDAEGRTLDVRNRGERGWELTQPYRGRLHVSYEVEYAALAARGWPAPREGVFLDATHLIAIGRSMFVTTRASAGAEIAFDAPRGWRAVTAWPTRSGKAGTFAVRTPRDLVENLVVFTSRVPDEVSAGGFRLLVVPMGGWQPAAAEVRRVLGAAVPRLVGLIGLTEPESYLVVLLPQKEHGGEGFRSSLALTFEDVPSRANAATWGNTLVHEIFHYWNGGRLREADYASLQWFHEGFTEYAANVTMVAAGLVSPEEFARKLSYHVATAKKLTTTLEQTGGHKGPPLYSAGALVAFSWDVFIRRASNGDRSLGDFLKALWRQTDRGAKPYAWPDIELALHATAPHDWAAFHHEFIAGTEPLPLAEVFPLAGLRLDVAEDGTPRVALDPSAPPASRALWKALVRGR